MSKIIRDYMRATVLCLTVILLPICGGAATVGPEVAAEISRKGEARVVVQLRGEQQSTSSRQREHRVALVQKRVLDALAPHEFRLTERWTSLHGFAGMISSAGLATLASHPDVVRIDVDAGGGGHLEQSSPLVGATTVHSLGYTGAGVVVAVLDSGIRASHPDLGDALIGERCFCRNGDGTGCCPDGSTDQSGAGSATDDHGHGTNVTGIITSNGTSAPKGIAPDASIVAIKVLDASNRFDSTSQIISALDWIISSRPDVQVVNMSLGTDARFAGACDDASSWTALFATAIDTLRARGTTCFVSAGNEADLTSMGAPACVGNSIAVGAVWDTDGGGASFSACTDPTRTVDRVTCFSNSGTALDLLAPGAAITSAGLSSSTSTFYGTSQAAPHAAAGAALLLSRNPNLTANDVETALETTGKALTDHRTGSVFPRLSVQDAIAAVPAAGGCSNSDTTLCIQDRFAVSIEFETAQGGGLSGSAHAVPTTPIGFTDGGLFWFSSPNNPEMLVKVLNGCAVNSRYWFFASAGTNMGFTVTVRDTKGGKTTTYNNPDLNPAQPIQDTGAFATCP